MSTAHERAQALVRDVQAHPVAKLRWRSWAFATVLIVVGAAQFLIANWALGVLMLALGGWLARAASRVSRIGRVVQIYNVAHNATLSGRFDDASALLDVVEPQATGRYLRRLVAAQRTQIALYRGELGVVETEATRVLATPTGWTTGSAERTQMMMAQATRALARALSGDAEGALADAAAAEAYDEAQSTAIGRALLARLAVAARAGDLARLRELCRASAAMPALGDLLPRDRALYRSYRQLAFAAGPGAYRQAVNPDAAPEAEFFRVRPVTPDTITTAAAATQPGVAKLAHARTQTGTRAARKRALTLLGVWAALCVGLLAIWLLLVETPHAERGGHVPAAPVTGSFTWLTAGVFAMLVAALAYRVVTQRRSIRALAAARKAYALGRESEARALLEPLRSHRIAAYRACADLMLGQMDFAAAELERALAHIDAVLSALAPAAVRAAHSDLLIPLASEERAVALASLGRVQEARAQHALATQEHPTYALRVRAEHRVRLLCAVAERDWEAAREAARQRPAEAPLALREELLGDLVRMDEAASGAECERVTQELADAPALRRWLDVIAPGLTERALRVSTHEEATAEESAPEEAAPEEEDHGPPGRARRVR